MRSCHTEIYIEYEYEYEHEYEYIYNYIIYIYTHPDFARVQTLINLFGLMKDSNSAR